MQNNAMFLIIEILKKVQKSPDFMQNQAIFGGRGWIRTTEVIDNRFTGLFFFSIISYCVVSDNTFDNDLENFLTDFLYCLSRNSP